MTPEQMRELDRWISGHVFNWSDIDYDVNRTPYYTLALESAMEVQMKCVEKGPISVRQLTDGKWIVSGEWSWDESSVAETLPLAICKYAKELFSQK